jgi:hypothetical protein
MKIFFLMTSLLLTAAFAQADIAAPPAPTGNTQATKPTKEERKAMKEQRHAESSEMKEQIKTACAADITTTGCTSEFGHGLMKCIHAYKEANKDFKISDTCKAAAQEGRDMRKDRKEARKAKRG